MDNVFIALGLILMLAFVVFLVKPSLAGQAFTRKKALWVLLGGIFSLIVGSAISSPNPVATQEARVVAKSEPVFDVPSLVGKNIDQIRETLGKPTDDSPEPTKLQLDLMGNSSVEWGNNFTKNGITLLVTFNPKTRTVIDFFIPRVGDQDKASLLSAGNVQEKSSDYTIEFVKAIKNPSDFTGLKITPKR